MSLDGFDTLTRLFSEAAMNGLWQGLAITAIVWVALRTAPEASAATRFSIWSATLAAVLALPFVHLAGAFSDTAVGADSQAAIHLPPHIAGLLLAAWALIGAFMVGRLLWSYGYVAWLARTSTPLDPAWHDRVARLTCSSRVRLRASQETQVPIVIGFCRPAILVPAAMLDRLSPAEAEQIVLHEWEHIRRGDHWTNAALELIQCLFFFHPAVWCIGRTLRLERELACDDAVVAATGEPVSYAGCLAHLVELHSCPSVPLSPAAVSDARHLFHRVNRLLDWRGGAGFSVARFAVAAGLLLCAVIYARQLPQWIDIPAPALALESPRPAIAAVSHTLVMEERIRAASILMDSAQRRLHSAARIMRQAQQQMRLAAQIAQGTAPPPVPVSRVACEQPGPAPVPKLSKI